MTNPKIPTTSLNDSRIYLWDGGRYPSVTSVVGMLPKPGLQFWIAKTVAQAAIDMSDVGLPPQQKDHHWLKTAARPLRSAPTSTRLLSTLQPAKRSTSHSRQRASWMGSTPGGTSSSLSG